VDDQSHFVETVVRQAIERCRCEIDAAWLHVEAAKDILRRSQWLLSRWDVQRAMQDAASAVHLPAFDIAKAGMFVLVESKTVVGRRRKRRVTTAVPSDRHSRRRSASG
jgi:hypothetical protein